MVNQSNGRVVSLNKWERKIKSGWTIGSRKLVVVVQSTGTNPWKRALTWSTKATESKF